jgi:hypothetical protein
MPSEGEAEDSIDSGINLSQKSKAKSILFLFVVECRFL